jgi:hypothetical protein
LELMMITLALCLTRFSPALEHWDRAWTLDEYRDQLSDAFGATHHAEGGRMGFIVARAWGCAFTFDHGTDDVYLAVIDEGEAQWTPDRQAQWESIAAEVFGRD